MRKQLLTRLASISLIPVIAVATAIDTTIGLGAECINALQGYRNPNAFKKVCIQTSSTQIVGSKTYQYVLLFINPDAKLTTSKMKADGFLAKKYLFKPTKQKVQCDQVGGLSNTIHLKLLIGAEGISKIVLRTLDGTIIAIPATALSIATFGQYETLNTLAYNALKATGVVRDILLYKHLFFIGNNILSKPKTVPTSAPSQTEGSRIQMQGSLTDRQHIIE